MYAIRSYYVAESGIRGGVLHEDRRVGPPGHAVEEGRVATRIAQGGELFEELGHLVAALAAAEIDDDVGVAAFRERFEQHGLAGAESAP